MIPEGKNRIIAWGAVILLPILLFYLTEFMLYDPFTDMTPGVQLYNLLLFLLCFCFLSCITGEGRYAFLIECSLASVFTLVNFYVLRFRSKPVMPADVFSLKTAVSVADNYDYTPSVRVVGFSLAILLLIYVGFRLFAPLRFPGERNKNSSYPKGRPIFSPRVLTFLGCFVLFLLWCLPLRSEAFLSTMGFYQRPYTPDQAARHDGLILNFLKNMTELMITPPEGYSAQAAEALLDEYQTDEYQALLNDETQKPNLVIMMNEAFSDPGMLGELELNRDPIPYVHSLLNGERPGVSSGVLNVSVLGGNTANTEFEVLTGLSMAFLPDGSIPYQQYLRRPTQSLASILGDQGYRTISLHPYYSTGWRRDRAYPLMGFREIRFIGDFLDPGYLREYVDDHSCVEEIKRIFEEKGEERSLSLT